MCASILSNNFDLSFASPQSHADTNQMYIYIFVRNCIAIRCLNFVSALRLSERGRPHLSTPDAHHSVFHSHSLRSTVRVFDSFVAQCTTSWWQYKLQLHRNTTRINVTKNFCCLSPSRIRVSRSQCVRPPWRVSEFTAPNRVGLTVSPFTIYCPDRTTQSNAQFRRFNIQRSNTYSTAYDMY